MDESIRQRNRKAVDLYNKIMAKKKIIGGDTFPLSPENTKALGRAVEDDVYRQVAKESVGKAGMVSGIKAREKMLASGKLAGEEATAAKNFIANAEKYLFPESAKAAPAELSMAEKLKAAENASIERGAKGLEKNLVSPTAEKYKAVLTEGEKKMTRSILSGNIGKAAPMETPYGKSLLSYTPEGKIAGKTGSMLRGVGRVAGPLGVALTALDLAQALGEVQDKGAAKIAEDYKKSKMAESEAEILTPEADQFRESLKSRRTELEILRAELERKRKEEERARERESRGMQRQARVRDTLEQTGLIP
jgi:hypothetical protein